jgi:cytochrome c
MSRLRHIHLIALAALLAAPAAFSAGIKGNAANGKELFTSRTCAQCHGVSKEDTTKLGPNLVGVVGRKAGTKQGLMPATDAMKKYAVKWTAKTLDAFLANPQEKAPGVAMTVIMSDAKERADVIAYLATLKK